MRRRGVQRILNLGVGHRVALRPELGWHFGVPLGHAVPDFGVDFDLGIALDLGFALDAEHWGGIDLGP